MTTRRSTLGLLLLMLAASAARADTVYSNFAPGYADSGSAVSVAGNNVGGEYYAVAFTPLATETLTDAQADLVWFIGQDTINAFLLADNSGAPGTGIATLNQTTAIVNGIEMFTCSSACPTLQAGVQYWFELQESDPHTDIGWYVSSVDVTNDGNTALGYTYFPSGTWTFPNEPANAFEIDGQAAATIGGIQSVVATPEPNGLILALTGFAGLAGGAARRRKK